MPKFFFNLRNTAFLQPDELGTEFPDLDAAYLDACVAVMGMAADMERGGCNPLPFVFEIMDERGQLLLEVPFTEMLNAGEKPRKPTPQTARRQPSPQVERSQRLACEILDRITALQETVRQSRILVARSRSQIATGMVPTCRKPLAK